MKTAFISLLVLVVAGIIVALSKKKSRPIYNSDEFNPMKYRPVPASGAPAAGQSGDPETDQSAVDTAKAAAGYNQPQG